MSANEHVSNGSAFARLHQWKNKVNIGGFFWKLTFPGSITTVMPCQPDLCDRGMNLAYKKSKMKGSLTLKQHLESGCPWRWIKQIQRRLNWRIIVAMCHHARQTANMSETQNKKMVWLLFWRNNSRRLAWQRQRCRFASSVFASRRWGRRIVIRSRPSLII